MLSQLTKEGVTVVTVVHQPRYTIFSLFDHLILLGFGGHTNRMGLGAFAAGSHNEAAYAAV